MTIQTAKRASKVARYSGGLESRLDTIASVVLVMQSIASLYTMAEASFFFGVCIAISGIASYLLIRAVAEVIRLLKKGQGLNYGGEISQCQAELEQRCGSCGSEVHDWKNCVGCGAVLED